MEWEIIPLYIPDRVWYNEFFHFEEGDAVIRIQMHKMRIRFRDPAKGQRSSIEEMHPLSGFCQKVGFTFCASV